MKLFSLITLPTVIIISLGSCQSTQKANLPSARTPGGKKTEKVRIAVMNLKADDVSEATARKTSELIRTEMSTVEDFVIIERSQMDKILKEQGFQQTGCTDQSCAIKAGRLLSANKIFVGTVMRLGNKIILTGRIVDSESGVVDYSGKASSQSLHDLDTACGILIRDINNRINKGNTPTVKNEDSEGSKDPEDSDSLEYANFYQADLRKMHFVKRNLKYANLQGANLQGVNLREANLKHANMKNANLRNTDLEDADLKYTDLRGADLRGANIEEADMKYSKMSKAVIETKWRMYIMKNCKNVKGIKWVN